MKLGEFEIQPGGVCIGVMPETGASGHYLPSDHISGLDDEVADWRTFGDVQSTCANRRVYIRIFREAEGGMYLADQTVLMYANNRGVVRVTPCFPPEMCLKRLGLDEACLGRIRQELTCGREHGYEAVCREFPVAPFNMCTTAAQIVRFAAEHSLWPELQGVGVPAV